MVQRDKREEKSEPQDLRCGIVETYRNVSIEYDGYEGAYCGGSAVRVVNYGKSCSEKRKKDLPVRWR